jgi:hypothetical protein
MACPLGGGDGGTGAPTTQLGDVDGAPPPRAPLGVRTLSIVQACVVTCIGNIDRSNSAHGSHFPALSLVMSYDPWLVYGA